MWFALVPRGVATYRLLYSHVKLWHSRVTAVGYERFGGAFRCGLFWVICSMLIAALQVVNFQA